MIYTLIADRRNWGKSCYITVNDNWGEGEEWVNSDVKLGVIYGDHCSVMYILVIDAAVTRLRGAVWRAGCLWRGWVWPPHTFND